MRNRRCCDEAGIIVQMLKEGCEELLECILDLFNEVLRPELDPPQTWRRTKLVVIFKKGDPMQAKNYRPIAILPILYKVFSRMFCNRIADYLIPGQSCEQAAYRKGFSTEDHLLCLTLLVEGTLEWNNPLWIASVDFENALDTVEHAALFNMLLEQGVPASYVEVLLKLYEHQVAVVQADAESRPFGLSRGVKQGDPISALLFIAVMEASFREMKSGWSLANKCRKSYSIGVNVDSTQELLTNLRFADDVLFDGADKIRCSKKDPAS